MIGRNRAWRRSKSRNVISRVKATQAWLIDQFNRKGIKPNPELKQHRHGALTRTQDLKAHWSTELELREAA